MKNIEKMGIFIELRLRKRLGRVLRCGRDWDEWWANGLFRMVDRRYPGLGIDG